MVPAAIYNEMSLLPWSPLAGGFLSGKYKRGSAPEAGTRAASDKALYQMVSEEYADSDQNWATIDAVVEIAKRDRLDTIGGCTQLACKPPRRGSSDLRCSERKAVGGKTSRRSSWSLTPRPPKHSTKSALQSQTAIPMERSAKGQRNRSEQGNLPSPGMPAK